MWMSVHDLCHHVQLISSVNNLTGEMYMTHTGALQIYNVQSNRTAVMAFGEPGSSLTSYASTRKDKNIKVCALRTKEK